MHRPKTQLLGAALALLLLQVLAACSPSAKPLTKELCAERYEALVEEEQADIRNWAERIRAAQGSPEFDAVRAEGRGIALEYLPRFRELADAGCGQAKLEVLDKLHYLVDPYTGRLDDAFGMLEELVHEHTNAPWICDLADDEVIGYFLLSPKREQAIALLEKLVRTTTDEEAPPSVLCELGLGRLQYPTGPAERQAALDMLEQVATRWPETQYAEIARRRRVLELDLQPGKLMPALQGLDVDGQPITLESHLGKVVVVDFFGFWCPPCIKGLPALAHLRAQYPEDSLSILGIDVRDNAELFRRGRARHAITWPCIFDGPQSPLAASLGIYSFPTVFVLDQTGTIRAKNPTETELQQLIQTLVAGD